LTKQQFINTNEGLCIRFLNATRKGYLFAQKHPSEALSLFMQYLSALCWLVNHQLENESILHQQLYTNELLS
jgi:hypothetical protein